MRPSQVFCWLEVLKEHRHRQIQDLRNIFYRQNTENFGLFRQKSLNLWENAPVLKDTIIPKKNRRVVLKIQLSVFSTQRKSKFVT